MLPEFFVVGAQKAGSTYLLRCLGEHPQVFMPPGEVAFFEDNLYSADRIVDFEKHFAMARPGQIVGVKRPNLLGHPECPERLQRHMPNLKIIVILRNPVDRAISGYFHYMKTGMLPVVPVEIGLRKILNGQYTQFPRASEVLEFGLYGMQLYHFEKYFPRENFHVMLLEDMKTDAQGQLAKLYDFIGVRRDFHPESFDSQPMQAPYSITRLRLWNVIDSFCRKWTADGRYFDRMRGPITTPLSAINNILDQHVWERLFPATRPKLSASLQGELENYYRSDAKLLESWLSRPLNHGNLMCTDEGGAASGAFERK